MNAKFASILRKHYPIFIYLTLYFLLFAYKFIASPTPFYDWDESIYAQVAREMIDNFSLVPLWQGQYWLDKPPLVPLFYGLIFSVTPFMDPEISGRLATLFLSVIALGMIYVLYFRVIKETYLTTLVVMITSLVPIFIQRSQALNIDVFLLIGWLGYILFYKRYRLSLFFLAVAVLSKTLVGFYPAWIIAFYHLYLYITKRIRRPEFRKIITRIVSQVSIVGIWYVVMFIFFGKAFWVQHIYETHFKRVSASIESHFGQRTYYIDLLFQQFSKSDLFIHPNSKTIIYALLMLAGLSLLVYRHFKTKKIDSRQILNGTFILPWFFFLNIAKTKIFWYSYPYITQFAFLLVYPVTLLRKWNWLYYGTIALLFIYFANYYFFQEKVLAAQFSQLEPHQELAVKARNLNCNELNVLISKDGRTTYETLNAMDLTITTTTWWGEHPSIVYYFGNKVNFIYKLDDFSELIEMTDRYGCLIVSQEDLTVDPNKNGLLSLKKAGNMHLFMKVHDGLLFVK